MSMLQFTVKTLTGQEQQFVDIDETSTVGAFNAVVATRTESPVEDFRMYRGATYLVQSKTLKDVGVVDGAKLRMQARQDKQQRAKIRINTLGVRPKIGGTARSSKYNIRAGNGEVRNDIRAGKEDVIDTVCVEGAQNRAATQECLAQAKQTNDIIMGKPRATG